MGSTAADPGGPHGGQHGSADGQWPVATWSYRPVDGPELIRAVHLVAAFVSLVLTVVLAATLAAERVQRRRTLTVGRPSRRQVSAAGGGVLVSVMGMLTGPLLAWDTIGLWAVAVPPPDVRGLRGPWSEHARFVIVNGSQVDLGTYKLTAVVHVMLPLLVVLPVAVVGTRRLVGSWQQRPEAWRPKPPGAT